MKKVLLSAIMIQFLAMVSFSNGTGKMSIPDIGNAVMAAPPNWVPKPNMLNNMSVIAKVQLCQGGFAVDANDIVGAFVGSECRGVSNPMGALGGILFLSVGSDLQSGETVTFKAYLSASDQIVDLKETIAFESNKEVGTIPEPFVFTYNCACILTVNPLSRNVTSGAGTTTFEISFTGCSPAWSVTDDADWLTVSPASGTGSGTITVSFTAFTTPGTRTGTVTVSVTGQDPVNVTVIQTGSSSSSCVLNFKTGWNLFSSDVMPANPDLMAIFQPLITNGSLIKIQDELGKALEDFGIFGGWKNNIGNLLYTEGYKIKVKNDCQLTITGTPAVLPFNVPLNLGWNIIGYPRSLPADGMMVVQQLINRKTLVKVQDELGKSIEDFGIFGGWKNNIGNFLQGEGYKVKVTAAETLTIQVNYP